MRGRASTRAGSPGGGGWACPAAIILALGGGVGPVYSPFCLAVSTQAPDVALHRFSGRIARTLSAPADVAPLLPTDLAASSKGHIALADGVHDRILIFSPEGELLSTLSAIGDLSLSRPLGVAFDDDDRLWIADTGRRRLVTCDLRGDLLKVLPLPRLDGDEGAISDVVVTADGRFAFAIDNLNHRLIRVETETGAAMVFGSPGTARGQFNHPYRIAANGRGLIAVSDVINARVSLWREDGTVEATAGSFGVDFGGLFRPKGVAFDEKGRLWVCDGRLGVVSVFDAEGAFIDVLRGDDGGVMRFDMPCGVAFGADGALLVLELRSGCVLSIVLTEQESAPAVRAGRTDSPSTQPQSCTVCHIEWVWPIVEGRSTELLAIPDNSPTYPLVSREENCLSCHDGSVSDSRRRVWREHGHRSGVTPPPEMSVPSDLPLADGQVVCRTCHSAHTRGGSGNTMKEAVFLRVTSDPAELCVRCHTDIAGGAGGPSHPMGERPDWRGEIGELSAGAAAAHDLAEAPPSQSVDTCLDCHAAHGAGSDAILKVEGPADALCLECHAGKDLDWREPASFSAHSAHTPLDALRRESLTQRGLRPAWASSAGCLACHKMHGGALNSPLLAESTCDASLCSGCHADKQRVIGTTHDLQVSAPHELNSRGETAGESGPCGACHAVHRSARPPFDPAWAPAAARNEAEALEGQVCLTCHHAEGCSPFRLALPFAHPVIGSSEGAGARADDPTAWTSPPPETAGLRCGTCHDPHSDKQSGFLRAAADDLCANCHADKKAMAQGPHDFLSKPEFRNGAGRPAERTGRCGACHAVHGKDRPALWKATEAALTSAEGLCLNCHSSSGGSVTSPARALLHPLSPSSSVGALDSGRRGAGSPPVQPPVGPLFDAAGRRCDAGDLSCATCHDPHADVATSPALLRLLSHGASEDLCARCHVEAANLQASAHSHESLMPTFTPDHTCGPCHSVHAPQGEAESRRVPSSRASSPGSPMLTSSCLVCHNVGGGARTPGRFEHPEFLMSNIAEPGSPGFMPLAGMAGSGSDSGRLTCTSCHLPHGRFHPESIPEATRLTDPLAVIKAMKPMVRPFITPNLCTQCHGEEALQRYLLFHRWPRRGEPSWLGSLGIGPHAPGP